jgi:hypothetical protein
VDKSLTKYEKQYDILNCLHTLEHIPDIGNAIENILKFNCTHMLIEVPFEKIMQQYSSIEDQIKNKQYWHEHINFFSPKSFTALLQPYFDIIDTKTENNCITILCKKKKQIVLGAVALA